MFAGGKIGIAFSFTDILWITALGNFLLASYAASLGVISARSGLNTVLMGRFCFDNLGSKDNICVNLIFFLCLIQILSI